MSRYFKGGVWALAERLVATFFGLLISVVMARKLGPALLGEFSYMMALSGIFAALVPLGTQRILVRELVKNPGDSPSYLWTALIIRVVSATVGFVLLLGIAACLDGVGDSFWLAVCFGTMFWSMAFDVYGDYFQAQVRYQVFVKARLAGLIISAPIQIGVVLAGWPLYVVALGFVCRYWFDALFLILFYRKDGHRSLQNTFSKYFSKELLVDGVPLALSTIAVILYTRSDMVMLKHMQGAESAGIYSIAGRIYNPIYALFPLIGGLLYPAVVKAKKVGDKAYWEKLEQLLSINFGFGIVALTSVLLMGHWLISVLFGATYGESANILMIKSVLLIVQGVGLASSAWFITEGETKLALHRNVMGLLINVGLNLWLIPIWNGRGAALASVMAYLVSMHLALLFMKKTRPLFWLQAKVMTFVPVIKWGIYYARRYLNIP